MEFNDSFFDELTAQAVNSPRLRMNYDLRNTPEDCSQRMFNAVEPGSAPPIHRHLDTNATCLIVRGRIDSIFYDDNGNEIKRFCLDAQKGPYGVQIPKGQWHSLESHESGSVLFEAKDGVWHPIEGDELLK